MKSGGRNFLLEAGFVILLLAAPIFFGAVHHGPSMALCSVLFLLFFLNPESISKISSLPRFFTAGAALVLLVIIFQTIQISFNRAATFRELLKWLAFAAGFLMLQSMSRGSILRFFWILAALGVLESLYGLSQVVSGHEKVLWKIKKLHQGYATGTYLNRNHMAGLLEISLGVQWGLFLYACRKKNFFQIILLLAGLGVCLLGFLKTGSRMGIASFAAAFVIFFFWLLMRREREAWIFLAAGILGAFGGWAAAGSVISQRFEEFSLMTTEAWGGRLQAWTDVGRLIQNHFWAGSGLGAFEWVFPAYQSPSLLWGWTHAHNDYLELAAGLGVPVFTVLILAFTGLVFSILRACRKENKAAAQVHENFLLIAGVLMGCFSFLLHSLTDFNFAIPANAMIWIFGIAMAFRLSRPGETGGPP